MHGNHEEINGLSTVPMQSADYRMGIADSDNDEKPESGGSSESKDIDNSSKVESDRR